MAFVTPKGDVTGDEALIKELREHVGKVIGNRPPAVDRLHRRSTQDTFRQIMRRLLRDVAEGRELGDVTTSKNAPILDEIRAKSESQKATEG